MEGFDGEVCEQSSTQNKDTNVAALAVGLALGIAIILILFVVVYLLWKLNHYRGNGKPKKKLSK